MKEAVSTLYGPAVQNSPFKYGAQQILEDVMQHSSTEAMRRTMYIQIIISMQQTMTISEADWNVGMKVQASYGVFIGLGHPWAGFVEVALCLLLPQAGIKNTRNCNEGTNENLLGNSVK